MGLDVLLEILWSLECLATEIALMRLEWDVDTDVRGDVIPFDSGSATCTPSACQVEVVRALATNMTLANVILEIISTCILARM